MKTKKTRSLSVLLAMLAVAQPALAQTANEGFAPSDGAQKRFEEYWQHYSGIVKSPIALKTDEPIVSGNSAGSKSEERKGDYWVCYYSSNITVKSALQTVIVDDSSEGDIYPGGLFWVNPMMKHSHIEGFNAVNRAPIRCVVSGVVGSMSPVFDFDGSFSDYSLKLLNVIKGVSNNAARISYSFSDLQDVDAAFVQLGMSAKAPFSKIRASIRENRKKARSQMLICVEQVYFSTLCDWNQAEPIVAPRIFENENQARILSESLTNAEKGELGVFRRVSYGRRLLVSVTSSLSQNDLAAAINVHAGFLGFGGGVDIKSKDLTSENGVRVEAFLFGGAANSDFITPLAAKPDELLNGINRFVGETIVMTPETVAKPLSFDSVLASDLTRELIAEETVRFTGKYECGRSKAESTEEIKQVAWEFGPSYAKLIRGDTEMDTQDGKGTFISVVYDLFPSADHRNVLLSIVYDAREDYRPNRNPKLDGFGDTWFQIRATNAVFSLKPGDLRKIGKVIGVNHEKHQGAIWKEFHGYKPFPDNAGNTIGVLTGVQVSCDGKGGGDLARMMIKGKVSFNVQIEREMEFRPNTDKL